MYPIEALFDGGIIHVHNGLALFLEVGPVDGLLHLGDSLL